MNYRKFFENSAHETLLSIGKYLIQNKAVSSDVND